MRRFLYFAYGSNLLTPRLRARCPSGRVIGTAWAHGYSVEFSKLSHFDGSGKASLTPHSGTRTHGVIYEISLTELPALDRHEGLGRGYGRACIPVKLGNGTLAEAATYIGTDPQAGLCPFDWYLALVLAGAGEHSLDAAHITHLAATAYHPDPDPERATRRAAIDALRVAGHHRWQDLLPGTV